MTAGPPEGAASCRRTSRCSRTKPPQGHLVYHRAANSAAASPLNGKPFDRQDDDVCIPILPHHLYSHHLTSGGDEVCVRNRLRLRSLIVVCLPVATLMLCPMAPHLFPWPLQASCV